MKASEWLVRATQDLPAGVTARVKADTLAHLNDAGVDEAADVRPLLGRPEDTAAELRRLYLTNDEWQNLIPRKTFWSVSASWLNALIWPVFLIWSVFESRSPLNANWWLWGGCAVAVAAGLVLLTRLHRIRLRTWLELAGNLLFITVFVLLGLPSVFPMLFLFLMAMSVRWLWQIWRKDARLARTLALEGEQA